jgi:hypothetical protein
MNFVHRGGHATAHACLSWTFAPPVRYESSLGHIGNARTLLPLIRHIRRSATIVLYFLPSVEDLDIQNKGVATTCYVPRSPSTTFVVYRTDFDACVLKTNFVLNIYTFGNYCLTVLVLRA